MAQYWRFLLGKYVDLKNNALPNDKDSTLTFDRGYGKMTTVKAVTEQGFQICTFTSNIGSRHPFISETAIHAYRIKYSSTGVQELDRRIGFIQNWIVSQSPLLGAANYNASKALGEKQFLQLQCVRQSSYQCSICKIHLCQDKLEGEDHWYHELFATNLRKADWTIEDGTSTE